MRAATRLAVHATERVTAVVEEMHSTIAAGPAVLGRPLERPARLITGTVYGGIRAATRLVGAGLDLALAQLEPRLGERAPGPEREALIAALNGVIGDHLAETGNPFAIEMSLGRVDVEAAAGGRLLVLVHGSSMCASQWNRRGHDHGAMLAAAYGYTPVYAQYNSGRHVSTNGQELDEMLEGLVTALPRAPAEIVMLCHSMGGLVSRSACHAAERRGHTWRSRLTKLVCLGTPHHGAPLERGGNVLEGMIGVSRYSAPLARLARLRSAGVTDLRHGSVLDEHWQGRDRFAPGADRRTPLPLPSGVTCYAIAGTLARAPGGRLPGDGLVPVASALGRHRRADLTLAFDEDHTWIAYGTGHLELLGSANVYRRLAAWLGS